MKILTEISSNEFMGYFIAAIATIVAIVVPTMTLILNRNDKKHGKQNDSEIRLEKRFDNLDRSIQELATSTALLKQSIDDLSKKIDDTDSKERELESIVHNQSNTLANHEARISHLENANG